ALRGAQRPETGRRLLREVRGPLEGRGRRAPARRPRGAGPAGATGARAGNVSGAPEWDRGVLIAANLATVYGTIGRWLMHDVRSPAKAISLVGDLLDQPGTPPDSTLRDTLTAASARLNQCLQLLDHALRAAPVPAEPGPVALAGVIEQIAALHAGNHAGVRLDATQAPVRSFPA